MTPWMLVLATLATLWVAVASVILLVMIRNKGVTHSHDEGGQCTLDCKRSAQYKRKS